MLHPLDNKLSLKNATEEKLFFFNEAKKKVAENTGF